MQGYVIAVTVTGKKRNTSEYEVVIIGKGGANAVLEIYRTKELYAKAPPEIYQSEQTFKNFGTAKSVATKYQKEANAFLALSGSVISETYEVITVDVA
jgi:hypothetical protein